MSQSRPPDPTYATAVVLVPSMPTTVVASKHYPLSDALDAAYRRDGSKRDAEHQRQLRANAEWAVAWSWFWVGVNREPPPIQPPYWNLPVPTRRRR